MRAHDLDQEYIVIPHFPQGYKSERNKQTQVKTFSCLLPRGWLFNYNITRVKRAL